MSNRYYLVDFVEFEPRKGKRVVKELAVVDDAGAVVKHSLMKPPYDFHTVESASEKKAIRDRQEATGLIWNYGYEDYSNLNTILTEAIPFGARAYAKGGDNVQTLKNALGKDSCVDVEDLDDYECPDLEVLHLLNANRSCPFKHRTCALRNALCINVWWAEAKKLFDVIDAVGRSIKAVREAGFTSPTARELRTLPKEYLLRYETDRIRMLYENLPRRLRNDEDILKEMPCTEHYRLNGDTWDGPNPRRKYCTFCVESNRL